MNINEVREITGCGMGEIQEGMRQVPTRDPLLGACFMMAAGQAVKIKDNRREWNLRQAYETAERLREKHEKKENAL